MRVAWFHAGSSTSVDAFDATPALIRELSSTAQIDVISQDRAHAFVVGHAQRPYDLCVFAPRNLPSSDYIWGYLFQYPGVMLLQDTSLHDSRTRILERDRRMTEYEQEFLFNHGHPPRGLERLFARGSWPMLRAALLASKLVVVTDEERRRAIETDYPGVRVRMVPPHAEGPESIGQREQATSLRVCVVGSRHRYPIERTVERAAALGIPVALTSDLSGEGLDQAADVVIALDSPTEAGTLAPALAAMAHGKTVIVFERESTAIWPALDPQTWRARGVNSSQEPVVVSLDPRDEEHSLILALRRLCQDSSGRLALGTAARAWWKSHATPAHAAAAWQAVIEEAVRSSPPDRPADWPRHLNSDGGERARTIAAEFGIAVESLGL